MHAQVEAEVQFGAQTELRLRVHSAKPGLLWLEAQRGAVLSRPCPVILLPAGHDKLAAEVVRLVSRPAELARHAGQAPGPAELANRRYCEGCSWSDERCNDFLADLGLVLSKGTHSSSAAADLAHAWQCCVDGRQERSSGCSRCSSAPVSKHPATLNQNLSRGLFISAVLLHCAACPCLPFDTANIEGVLS